MKRLYIIPMMTLLFSCQSPPETLSDYNQWARDNEDLFFKEKTSEDYLFRLQYRTHEMIIAQELGGEADSSAIQNRLDKIWDLQYFNLYVSPLKAKGMSTVSIRNQHKMTDLGTYLSYRMQNDLILLEGEDTMKCVLFHFESYADLNQKNNFVLAFEQNDQTNTKPKTIILKPGMLNRQSVVFQYDTQTLTQIPQLLWER